VGLSNIQKEQIKDAVKGFCIRDNVNNPKVSIVVPAYNTEKYITKCLKSLISQTLKEIEIVVVNDGSTDGTQEIVSFIASLDSRIKLIYQTHAMQGAARNRGMQASAGEYVGFVDSDDWVDEDYYEKLYNAAIKYDSDIALAANIRIGNGKTKKRLNIQEEKFVQSLQDKCDISNQAKNPCPTNKIYRKTLLTNNNIVWPEGVYCEDKLFTIQAVYYANGIVAVPDIYYYYYRNPSSTVKKRIKTEVKKREIDKNNAKKAVLDFLKQKNVSLKNQDFSAIKKEIKLGKISVFKIKESLDNMKYYLFGIRVFVKAGGK